jgi:hypothetical protein
MEESRRQLQKLLDDGNAREAVRVMKEILDMGWIVEGQVQRGSEDGVMPGFAEARAEIALPVHAALSYRSQAISTQPISNTIRYPGSVAPFSGIGSRNPSFPTSEDQDLPIPTLTSQPPPSEEEYSVTETMHP